MIRAAYTGALYLSALTVGPGVYCWARLRRPRLSHVLRQRLGRVDHLPPPPATAPLWLHGVSLGEVRALRPLAAAWRQTYPERPLLVSSSTETGLDAAAELFGDGAHVTPFPLDTPGAVCALLDYWRPACVALLETELWPNFFWTCAERRIPLCLVSGRIGERTVRGSGWTRPFWRRVLTCGSAFAMQTAEDAERLTRLGAPPERISVLGNLKWDGATAPPPDSGSTWRQAWGLATETPLVLWGSTHAPEETLALETWRALRRQHPALRLCVAPRHPERFDAVAAQLTAPHCTLHRRSAGPRTDWDVLLLDSMGELPELYAAATVVMMGGTFAPVGGHNILEPMAAGVPVLVGPCTKNIRTLVRTAEAAGAVRCTTEHALVQAAERLLSDEAARSELVANGRRLLDAHRGTTHRVLELLDSHWPTSAPCGA